MTCRRPSRTIPRTHDLSTRSVSDIVRLINEEDALVAMAVQQELPQVAAAVEGIVARLENGGRLFYVGTGTSGRLGVLDASECPPTFGVPAELVQGIIAGGYEACHRAVEASEDDRPPAAATSTAVASQDAMPSSASRPRAALRTRSAPWNARGSLAPSPRRSLACQGPPSRPSPMSRSSRSWALKCWPDPRE